MPGIIIVLILLVLSLQSHAQLSFKQDNYPLSANDLKAFIGKDTVGSFKERGIFFQTQNGIEMDSMVGHEAVRKYFFKKHELGIKKESYFIRDTSYEFDVLDITLIDFYQTGKDVFLFYKVRWGYVEQDLSVLWINNNIVKGEYEDAIFRVGCGNGYSGVSLSKMCRNKDIFGYQVYGEGKKTFKYKIVPAKGLIKI